MVSDFSYWFVLFAILQGAFILGFSVFIFSYYFPKSKKMAFLSDNIRWHIVLIALSYFLLTLGTVITSAIRIYSGDSAWYYIIATAYVLGDISLYKVFRHSVYRTKREDNLKKRIADLESRIDNQNKK